MISSKKKHSLYVLLSTGSIFILFQWSSTVRYIQVTSTKDTHVSTNLTGDGNYSVTDNIPLYMTTNHIYNPSRGAHLATLGDIPNPHSNRINCPSLLHMNPDIYKDAASKQHYKINTADEDTKLEHLLTDCAEFRAQRKYIERPVSQEEQDFPIAYVIMAYKDAFQVERLLRAIYRPQNLYCIHLDKKYSEVFGILKKLEGCFPNVIVPGDRVVVNWGWWSVVEGELVCQRHLLERRTHQWRYYINLAGWSQNVIPVSTYGSIKMMSQEFPLKTNHELIRILKAYDGANDIMNFKISKQMKQARLKFDYKEENKSSEKTIKKPFNQDIKWRKGSLHIAAKREFIEYIANDTFAKSLKEYLKHTRIPDETFYATLNGNPEYGIPGSYTGNKSVGSLLRYKLWIHASANRKSRHCDPMRYFDKHIKSPKHKRCDFSLHWCYGKFVREICNIAIGDVKQVVESPNLFVNKLPATYSPLTYDCLEELLFTRIRSEIVGNHTFSLDVYKNNDFVKNHI